MMQRLGIALSIIVLLALVLIIVSNIVVGVSSRSRLYSDINRVPTSRVGLLLGTSKYLHSGYPNPYFYNRVATAARLFHAGKIEYVLASGDNRSPSYNEPEMMLQELREQGVPPEAIMLDHGGINTLASVARSGLVFGNRQFIVISQRFHNQRALYIADYFGFDAIAFDAATVAGPAGLPVALRELLARVKVMLDLYLWQIYPRSAEQTA